MAEVTRKLFENQMQLLLFPDKSPFKNAQVVTGVNANVSSVEIPNQGSFPAIQKNPSKPITAQEVADTKQSYDVDEYVAPPVRVTEHNNATVTYDKNRSTLVTQANQLNAEIGDQMGFKFAPSVLANMVRTSGLAGGHLVTGASGSRSKLVMQDLIDLGEKLDNMNVPDDGRRILLFSTGFWSEFLALGLDQFVGADKLSSDLIAKGYMGQIFNFNCMKRPKTVRYDNAATPARQAVGAAGSAAMNDAILAWHPDFVHAAEGKVNTFYNKADAEHVGDVMSHNVRAGGAIARLDEVGAAAIVQKHV
jgi:hypothetical protein